MSQDNEVYEAAIKTSPAHVIRAAIMACEMQADCESSCPDAHDTWQAAAKKLKGILLEVKNLEVAMKEFNSFKTRV